MSIVNHSPIPFLDLKSHEAVDPSVIARVVERGRFIGGPEVLAFEAAFAQYCGVSHCAAVGNGTDALELALRAAGIQAGDEVATVANAGMYGTTAIRAIGALPLYIDIDPSNLLISPSALAVAIGPRTRAVIATHLYGQMAPMLEILEIAAATSLAVIEDCAQAHGAQMAGRRAGSWGTAAAFSFYPTKNLGAYGDAGAVVTSDSGLASRLRALREYGWTQRFHSTIPGGRNSRMDEIQAAVLNAKLPSLDRRNARRSAIAQRYSSGLERHGGYKLLPINGESSVAHLYVVSTPNRDLLQSWLMGRGIGTEIHYPVPDHLQASQASLEMRQTRLPATESCVREVLSIPCFPELEDNEVEYVLASMRAWKP
jgi:aminotransferase EvaB